MALLRGLVFAVGALALIDFVVLLARWRRGRIDPAKYGTTGAFLVHVALVGFLGVALILFASGVELPVTEIALVLMGLGALDLVVGFMSRRNHRKRLGSRA